MKKKVKFYRCAPEDQMIPDLDTLEVHESFYSFLYTFY